MRQRAISAAVLVPVLLVVLFFGGVVLAAAVAIITVFAAMEAFRLLRSAGHEGFAALGTVLALSSSTPPSRTSRGQRTSSTSRWDRPRRGRIVHTGRPA
jgi:CDP-diglyceride synthetase